MARRNPQALCPCPGCGSQNPFRLDGRHCWKEDRQRNQAAQKQPKNTAF